MTSLEKAGLRVHELTGVKPNPRVSLVRKGIELVRKKDIDFIVAIGGGSGGWREVAGLNSAAFGPDNALLCLLVRLRCAPLTSTEWIETRSNVQPIAARAVRAEHWLR